MSTERRAPPRMVPTLTAVVEAQAPAGTATPVPASPTQQTAPETTPAASDQAWVQAVLQQLDGPLMQGLQPLLDRLVTEQSAVLAHRLRAEIEPLVRDLVAQELARRGEGKGG